MLMSALKELAAYTDEAALDMHEVGHLFEYYTFHSPPLPLLLCCLHPSLKVQMMQQSARRVYPGFFFPCVSNEYDISVGILCDLYKYARYAPAAIFTQ
jgi:hypothetical protein